jgi:hypothetical protein
VEVEAGAADAGGFAMKAKAIGYWVTTGLLCAELVTGGVWDVSHSGYAAGIVARLGYPVYILTILGVWKLLAVPALIAPGVPRLKEWAYAGIFFEMTGAAASHAACGELKEMIVPSILTVLGMASWWMRPPGRTMGTPAHSE